MILEREQWHLGYASLLRDCREGGGGRALLLVHPDVDAMSSARILGYMLRADGVPHQMRPCPGWGRLRRVLSGMGVVALPPPPDDDDVDDDEDGDGGGRRGDRRGADAIEDDDEDGVARSSSSSCDVRAVVLVNMGANRNLAKLFSSSGGSAVRCYVLDCHRPYHLANVHAGKGVVLFNDRPFEDMEVPSDGDDLSGNDETSVSDDSSDDDGGDDDDGGGGGRRRGGGAGKGWEDDDSGDEGEREFELEDKTEGGRDEDDEDEDEDEDASDEESEGGDAKPAKRRRTTEADDPARPDDDDLRDSDDEDDEEDRDNDEYGGGKTTTKKGRIRTSSTGRGGGDPLNTTAATADLTMNVMDETLMTAGDEDEDDDDDDDGNGGGPMTSSSSSSPSDEVVDLRELRRLRRSRVRLHYSSGSYHGSPSSWSAYALCRQLRFGDVPDLLWLACVGVTDAYLHGRLDVAGYSALSVDLRRHVGRLFPNDAVDRAGRAVYAEELEDDGGGGGGGGGGRALTMIGLSENGRILFQDEYKFMLLRHTSLWDSMLHSNYVASKLQVWKSAGRRRLMELLAKMGFPLDQCRQPWAFVGPGMRRRLGERLGDCTEVRRDGHDARRSTFF